ncbi:MAG: CinA family protein [Chloroflexota bacterium]|nr:CinA family protein [Chloroflexota bacterium]
MPDNPSPDTVKDVLNRAHHLLLRTGLTVSVAESCTGGLLGGALTELSGSSEYFLGGVIAYADSAKIALLGVDELTIVAHGAVSGPVALEMAEGAKRATSSDIAISITGIAGPTGGTEQKPVGTTFIGISGLGSAHVERFVWTGDRAENRAASVRAALELLVELIDRSLSAVPQSSLHQPHSPLELE